MTSRKHKLRHRASTTAKRLAAAYKCGHCSSETAGAWADAAGVQHVGVAHDDGCPVLTGALPDTADVMRAFARADITPGAVLAG